MCALLLTIVTFDCDCCMVSPARVPSRQWVTLSWRTLLPVMNSTQMANGDREMVRDFAWGERLMFYSTWISIFHRILYAQIKTISKHLEYQRNWLIRISYLDDFYFFPLLAKYSQRARPKRNAYFIHKTISVREKIAQSMLLWRHATAENGTKLHDRWMVSFSLAPIGAYTTSWRCTIPMDDVIATSKKKRLPKSTIHGFRGHHLITWYAIVQPQAIMTDTNTCT